VVVVVVVVVGGGAHTEERSVKKPEREKDHFEDIT
jgi:hypothetical protein